MDYWLIDSDFEGIRQKHLDRFLFCLKLFVFYAAAQLHSVSKQE